MLTVRQLIEALERIEDKGQPVEIALRQYNKTYPVAYVPPFEHLTLSEAWGTVRIHAALPDNMRTMTLKERA
jgi:hypothetical protein